jgi:low temperature requirement protein LtrA
VGDANVFQVLSLQMSMDHGREMSFLPFFSILYCTLLCCVVLYAKHFHSYEEIMKAKWEKVENDKKIPKLPFMDTYKKNNTSIFLCMVIGPHSVYT